MNDDQREPIDKPISAVEVPAALAGERIDRVVSMLTGCSRSEATTLIEAGSVTINGEVVSTRSRRLEEGDEVAADRPARAPANPIVGDPSVALAVVHADELVIVVDKPAGLVVHPGAGHAEGTLVNGLVGRFPDLVGVDWPDASRPGIVHRIDRGTSGLLVIARTLDAYESLVGQLSARTVERRYVALVWGRFDAPAGEIDGPIARSHRDPTKMTVAAGGKDARTGYVVEHEYHDPAEVALVSCRLFTGRTHQIRVHMRSIGHPVVGDARYAGYRQSLPMRRPFLHAATLGFDHPSTGQRLVFESPLPADLASVLARLS
ncbi:MAG: RluA family pseudouridine synthase [Actinobacteria bacterium]|nr:RluA family pseudouridine synthase [Actinomycetota bacterium]